MAIFRVYGTKNSQVGQFYYDNSTSELTDLEGIPVSLQHLDVFRSGEALPAWVDHQPEPVGKTREIKRLKIQLGLSCNYSCEYCSQRFVPHSVETTKNDVVSFMQNLPNWFDGGEDGKGKGVRIEFWGGEPFVYWKTMKPLAEALHEKYPEAQLSVITNGSLLDKDKNQWLDELGFMVGVSHDGPGQHVRGPDPLADDIQRAAILDLFSRLHPKHLISFNSVLTRQNTSRADIQKFFVQLTGSEDVTLSEGSFIDPYDEGGMSNMMQSIEEYRNFTQQAFIEIATGQASTKNQSVVEKKITGFVRSILAKRPSSVLGQKCGMDRPDNIAVDLKGNVLSCQNVSAAATAMNGKSHNIGKVEDLDNVKLVTARHWSTRKNCNSCPVLQLCQGSCMMLEDKFWDAACDTAFADNIPFFAYAFELITGYRPFRIDGGLAERVDIWRLHPVSKKRVIILQQHPTPPHKDKQNV